MPPYHVRIRLPDEAQRDFRRELHDIAELAAREQITEAEAERWLKEAAEDLVRKAEVTAAG